MDAQSWLEKAARLQWALNHGAPTDDGPDVTRERIKIALWLKREFEEDGEVSNVVPHDFGAEF